MNNNILIIDEDIIDLDHLNQEKKEIILEHIDWIESQNQNYRLIVNRFHKKCEDLILNLFLEGEISSRASIERRCFGFYKTLNIKRLCADVDDKFETYAKQFNTGYWDAEKIYYINEDYGRDIIPERTLFRRFVKKLNLSPEDKATVLKHSGFMW